MNGGACGAVSREKYKNYALAFLLGVASGCLAALLAFS